MKLRSEEDERWYETAMKATFATPVDGTRDEFSPGGTMRVMSIMCNDIFDLNLQHGGCTMTRSDDLHLPAM